MSERDQSPTRASEEQFVYVAGLWTRKGTKVYGVFRNYQDALEFSESHIKPFCKPQQDGSLSTVEIQKWPVK